MGTARGPKVLLPGQKQADESVRREREKEEKKARLTWSQEQRAGRRAPKTRSGRPGPQPEIDGKGRTAERLEGVQGSRPRRRRKS